LHWVALLHNNGSDFNVHIIDGVQRMLRFAKHSLFASTGFADEPMVRQKAITKEASVLPVWCLQYPGSANASSMVLGKVKPSLADRRIALDSFRLGVLLHPTTCSWR